MDTPFSTLVTEAVTRHSAARRRRGPTRQACPAHGSLVDARCESAPQQLKGGRPWRRTRRAVPLASAGTSRQGHSGRRAASASTLAPRGLPSPFHSPIIMGQTWGKIFAKLLHTPLRSTGVDRATPPLTCGYAQAIHTTTSIPAPCDPGCRGFEPRHSPSRITRSAALSGFLTRPAGCSRSSSWGIYGAGRHRPPPHAPSAGRAGPAWTSPDARRPACWGCPPRLPR